MAGYWAKARLLLWLVGIMFLLPAPVCAAAQKEKVILDTDMVEMFDDGVALLMLARSPKVELLGVTCVTGNSWMQQGVAYALRQLELAGLKDIPVHEGMRYPLRPNRHALFSQERQQFGMGHDSWLGSLDMREPPSWDAFYRQQYQRDPVLKPAVRHAVNFIIETVRANPGEITIAAIGPCTNLAAAIRMAPDIVPLIKRVIYMGGAFFQQGNVTPAAEFNWWIDPEAARIMVQAPFREQVVFGLDVCEKVVFRREHYDRLLRSIGDGGMAAMLRGTFVGQSFAKDAAFTHFVWDVLVAAAIIDPSIITEERTCAIDVNTQYGPSYGQSLAYPKVAPAGCRKARIVTDVNQKRFWDMVNDRSYWTAPRR